MLLAPLRRHRWFGLTRWACLGVLVGLVGCLLVYGPWTQPSAQVRTIVAGLRSGSVYRQPGAPSLVDAAAARQLIGNRPIVLVLLDRTPLPADSDDPRMTLCEQIAQQVRDDYVWVYAADPTGSYQGNDCYGPDFPHPTKPGVSMDDFDMDVNIAAQLSAQYETTPTDLTAQLKEFVLSFDADAAQDYRAEPTRGGIPDALAVRQIVWAGVGMVAGAAALFLLLRLTGLALARRTARAVARTRRREELGSRLNEIADAVISPRPPRDAADADRQADTAQRYVLALDQLEHAHSDDELRAAGHEIDLLARRVRS